MHLTWGYDLVSQVQPGDRVLHWQTRAPRGLVGWSEVELISLIRASWSSTPDTLSELDVLPAPAGNRH